MYLSTVHISHFRRLTDVKIDLDTEISIFVGANNSGKTSVSQAIHLFLGGSRERFSFHDISASKWHDLDAVECGKDGAELSAIALDLWFKVGADDLHRVLDLLPSLDWEGTHVGVRITFGPKNQDETLARFRDRHGKAREISAAIQGQEGGGDYFAPPRTLREYLESEIQHEYGFRYFVLDIGQFNAAFEQGEEYEPLELVKEQGRTGRDIVNSLVKVDFLHAQRHLSDTAGGSRSEELSRHLSRYYSRNLEKHT